MFFFGNRNREADYIFGAEWQEMARRGQIQLFTAFSRDQVEWTGIERSVGRISFLLRQPSCKAFSVSHRILIRLLFLAAQSIRAAHY
jgi:hypothetical protein